MKIRYKGERKNSLFEGYGIYYFSSYGMKYKYEGQWKKGKRDGIRIQSYNKKFRNKGKWKNGKLEKFHYIINITIYLLAFLDSTYQKLINYLFYSLLYL